MICKKCPFADWEKYPTKKIYGHCVHPDARLISGFEHKRPRLPIHKLAPDWCPLEENK